jgi:hypothetical protein
VRSWGIRVFMTGVWIFAYCGALVRFQNGRLVWSVKKCDSWSSGFRSMGTSLYLQHTSAISVLLGGERSYDLQQLLPNPYLRDLY